MSFNCLFLVCHLTVCLYVYVYVCVHFEKVHFTFIFIFQCHFVCRSQAALKDALHHNQQLVVRDVLVVDGNATDVVLQLGFNNQLARQVDARERQIATLVAKSLENLLCRHIHGCGNSSRDRNDLSEVPDWSRVARLLPWRRKTWCGVMNGRPFRGCLRQSYNRQYIGLSLP